MSLRCLHHFLARPLRLPLRVAALRALELLRLSVPWFVFLTRAMICSTASSICWPARTASFAAPVVGPSLSAALHSTPSQRAHNTHTRTRSTSAPLPHKYEDVLFREPKVKRTYILTKLFEPPQEMQRALLSRLPLFLPDFGTHPSCKKNLPAPEKAGHLEEPHAQLTMGNRPLPPEKYRLTRAPVRWSSWAPCTLRRRHCLKIFDTYLTLLQVTKRIDI